MTKETESPQMDGLRTWTVMTGGSWHHIRADEIRRSDDWVEFYVRGVLAAAFYRCESVTIT